MIKMKTKICSVVFLIFYTLAMSISMSSQQERFHRRRIRLCGSALSDALSITCNGTYYNPSSSSEDKRFSFTYNDLLDSYRNLAAKSNRYPYQRVHSLFSNLNRKRGIVDECCYRSCTIGQMMAYCGEPSKSKEKQEERDIWIR